MKAHEFKGHLVLCKWNHRAREILRQWRGDARICKSPVVLIADLEQKPIEDDALFFVRGEVDETNLLRANIQKAKTAVVLGDDRLDAHARDAQVVLAALTIESLNPDVYSIVELVDERNRRHCERANVDEIIVSSSVSSRLVARAAVDHGLSTVLIELLSSRVGNDLMMLPVPKPLQGHPFLDVFEAMKRDQDSIVIAVRQADGHLESNPACDLRLDGGDQLIAIARRDMVV